MHKELHLDYETRSQADLKKVGLFEYAVDPTTEVWVCAYAFDEDSVEFWVPGMELPKEIVSHIKSKKTVIGHNVAFEVQITNNVSAVKYGWPRIDMKQTECTMEMAYAMALPGALVNAAPAVGMKNAKDMAGNRLMLQMSRPRSIEDDGTVIWWDEFEKIERLIEYCVQDVAVERELYKRLLKLSPKEKKIRDLSHKINQRGVALDIKSVKKAIEVVNFEKDRLDKEMETLTGGMVSTCRAANDIKRFLNTAMGLEGDQEIKSIAKDELENLLKSDIPDECKKVLELRKEAAKSSTAKLEKMISLANDDDRIRGMFQYSGASTRRWAGRGVQLHNLPRPKLPQSDIEDVIEALKLPTQDAIAYITMLHGPPLDVMSTCLRGFLWAENIYEEFPQHLIGCDFSAIEARVLAWLAGQEDKLELFRQGKDIYKYGAMGIFGVSLEEVDYQKRQVGKVGELALGFQGGKGAFQMMAKNYDVNVTDKQADAIKKAWRDNNPMIVKFWHKIEDLVVSAVRNPGTEFSYRDITYKMQGSFLCCKLPSGGVLFYPYPKLESVETPWNVNKDGVSFMKTNSVTNKWERKLGYGGFFTENITQAVARDLLAEAMLRLDEKGEAIVLHVHDEIVIESSIDPASVGEVESIMNEVPEWAKGLPINSEAFEGLRYRK